MSGHRVTTLLASCLLCGCSSFLPTPAAAPSLFTLDLGGPAIASTSASAKSVDATPTLIVNAPKASAGFDTSHMVYVRRPGEIDYFALSQWVDTPSRMLMPLMSRAIEQTGAFKAVLSAPSAAAGQYRLDTELVRMQHDFSSLPSRVRLSLRAVLIDTATRNVIARREFNASVASASEDAYGGVTAAQTAAQQVLAELAAFCAEAVAR